MATVKLNLLGGFELRSENDRVVAFALKKAKALLAYVALQPNQVHTRDKLASLLWEESSDAQARLSLRQALAAMRKALPKADDFITADSDSVTLTATPGQFEVDVLAFEALLSDASHESLRQAAALYQGEFLEGFNPRAPSFEDWLMAQRNRLREQAMQALSLLFEHAQAGGHDEDAVKFAMQLLALDPLRESVQRGLMSVYARQGRYGTALKQYRLCRTVLQRELGIGPEAKTDQLYRDIIQSRRQTVTETEAVLPLLPVPSRKTSAVVSVEANPSGFIGRRNQLQQFSTALDTCQETACGQAFLVRGEAGIGKTRLLEEFIAQAKQQGFICHQAAVLEFGASSSQTVISVLVRGLLGLAPAATIDQLPDLVPSSPERLALLHSLLDLPQPDDLKSLYEAMDRSTRRLGKQTLVADLITAVSTHQALLLVVEDIHWADTDTMNALAHIEFTVNDCPALLIMTSRVEGEPLDPGWRGAMQLAPLTTMDLGPLREGEALVLAQQLGQADNAFRRRCIKRAEGNPLFLEQLLQAGDYAKERLPDSVQAIVRARLQRLATADKQAAQAAAVLGQRFEQAALHALIENSNYTAEALVQQRLLRPQADVFWFTHALIMQGIYSSLTPPQRRALHRRAADWFAERDGILHAEHLERAEDSTAANAYLAAAQAQSHQTHYG
ncbi:MAG: AAA family ATPase, partial [Candidatus Competibacteraceae bacterium]|nr:AAA family ATPase [Candidatus Competibacteraceae bacterium]